MRGRKSLIIAAAVMVLAAGTMTGIYVNQQQSKQEEQQDIAKNEKGITEPEATGQEEEIPVTPVDNIVKPSPVIVEPNIEEEAEVIEPAPKEEKPAVSLHFSEESTMNWPLQGNVILNYSMDKTVYFATLDQYKYNPAVIISGQVNDKVCCAAEGKITDISTNEETGCTVTMDLGDGYSAIYGQLKQVPYEVGDVVQQGKLVGYITEPTKYYSVEGSNLYFAVQKDGQPVDPVLFFE